MSPAFLANYVTEDDKLQLSKSLDGCLKYFFQKEIYVKKQFENVYVCVPVLHEYINLLKD